MTDIRHAILARLLFKRFSWFIRLVSLGIVAIFMATATRVQGEDVLNAAPEADAMPSGKLFRDLDSALFGAAALGQPAMTVGFDTRLPPLGRGSFKPKLRE